MKRSCMLLTTVCTLILVAAGATVLFAAEGGHGETETWTPMLQFARVINFLILFGLLYYLLRNPLSNFFSERKSQIQKDLEEAKQRREEAERTLKDYEQKLADMEQELDRMRSELKKAADAESEKIVANADRMAEGMVEAAKLAAEQEVRKAKSQLRNESVEMAVQMAEALIKEKITDEDRKRIVEDYLSKAEVLK